jgi:hypothetical protein
VIVNNSTNINKTNNHLLPHIIEHKTKDHDNVVKCGRVKMVDGNSTLFLLASPMAIQI